MLKKFENFVNEAKNSKNTGSLAYLKGRASKATDKNPYKEGTLDYIDFETGRKKLPYKRNF